MGQIVVFSKKQCPHCLEAKDILKGFDIPFTEIDIESDLNNSMLMSYASKRHTVPQVFFNDQHIGGASELKQISADDVKQMAKEALTATNDPAFLKASLSEEELRNAIIPIKDFLDSYLPEDFVHLPEYKAIEIWYSQMFGFLCNCYDQMTLKPEPMSLFMPVLSSMMEQVGKEVGPDFGVACMATAFAADCAYCAAHGADLTMKYGGHEDTKIQELYEFLRGDIELQDLSFDDELKVIVLLAAGMSTQSISRQDMDYARSVVGIERLRSLCESIGGMGGIMGFLNRWNDMIGVEIEASIKQTIDSSALAEQWDWGTHDTEDDENRHVYRDPGEAIAPPSLEQFRQLGKKVRDEVFAERADVIAKYLKYDQDLLPAWIAILPDEDTTCSTTAFYHACLNEGEVSSELKHLANYAMLSGAGYPEMAAEEKRIAELLCDDAQSFKSRLAAIDKLAAGEEAEGDILNPQEVAAIMLARQAQRFPHVVRGGLVVELSRQFSPAQIVELVMSLAVSGIGQRWVGINKPLTTYLNNPPSG
jgi:glutaredoxin 3